jgi:hypothetical protein
MHLTSLKGGTIVSVTSSRPSVGNARYVQHHAEDGIRDQRITGHDKHPLFVGFSSKEPRRRKDPKGFELETLSWRSLRLCERLKPFLSPVRFTQLNPYCTDTLLCRSLDRFMLLSGSSLASLRLCASMVLRALRRFEWVAAPSFTRHEVRIDGSSLSRVGN